MDAHPEVEAGLAQPFADLGNLDEQIEDGAGAAGRGAGARGGGAPTSGATTAGRCSTCSAPALPCCA
ncbi:hypothetical protein, partial [Amycolatopsis solani]|uniref:hypothetical protein n=1 Tax=Amycolatopsis solani TaxID=3028615 RepID=UPI0025B2072C